MGRNPYMRWFLTRKCLEEKKEIKPSWWVEWLNIKASYPIGSTFKFLGKDMIVRYHSFSQPPSICCSYADNNGVIHDYRFDIVEWKLLTKLINTQNDTRGHRTIS